MNSSALHTSARPWPRSSASTVPSPATGARHAIRLLEALNAPNPSGGAARTARAPQSPTEPTETPSTRRTTEADEGTRTPDPLLTMEVLYRLSYVGAGVSLTGWSGGSRIRTCVG